MPHVYIKIRKPQKPNFHGQKIDKNSFFCVERCIICWPQKEQYIFQECVQNVWLIFCNL